MVTDMPRCTLLLVVDDRHLSELVRSLPTWYVCHPEMSDFEIVVMFDEESVDPECDRLTFIESVARDFGYSGTIAKVGWPKPGLSWGSHREKMLLAYVHGADFVKTDWFLKIDTDAIATKKTASFMEDSWFSKDTVFVSNPRHRISYTLKQLPSLEAWADKVPELSGFPTPDYHLMFKNGDPIKVCSWLMFGNTKWFQNVAKSCPRMPVSSQDSFHSYVAVKSGVKWVPVHFSRLGWKHKICKRGAVSPLLDKCPDILRRYGYEHYITQQR